MNTSELNVTEKTRELIWSWINAQRRLGSAQHELNSAQCDERNATNALGKWLTPDGPERLVIDEAFNIWFGSGVLEVKRVSSGDYAVKWRKEPDEKDRGEWQI